MKTQLTRGLLALLAVLALPSAALAQPEGAIVALHYQNEGDAPIVVGASTRGVVLLGSDLGNFRAFGATALGGGRPFFWIDDIDDDRHDEYVFAGSPSFVIDESGAPLFGANQGCDDFYAGNIIDDAMWELFCRRGSTLTVWNYDGQFLWEYGVTGMRLGTCDADDVDGDERLEFGCAAGDQYLLVDIANDPPIQEVPDNPAEPELVDPRIAWEAETRAAFAGERSFDLNGDRRAEETLQLNGSSLNLLDSGGALMASADLGTSDVYSVAVGDLDGDGTAEVFVGGVDTIYVVSSSGEMRRVEANPGRLHRDTRVTVASVAANNLADSSADSARAVVDGSMSALQRCYDRQMGSDPFIRVGGMMYELSIDDRGRVSHSQRIHSSVRNSDLETCVKNTLEDMRFSEASGGDGSVSIRLGFDFVDR